MTHDSIRNVAIIAHVDHGKTTLVDQLLKQSGMFRVGELDKLAGGQHGLIMDSNPIERERGITILSKNCAIQYLATDGRSHRINIIDTPGHADFGGEVERVLRMADGCLLVIDAYDGPMPQTRYVLGKALELGLRPVVVVNKCDRPDARPQHAVNEVFSLLIDLGADHLAEDFPVIFCSAREGWASYDYTERGADMRPVFDAIIRHVPQPNNDASAPLQMLVNTLDYSEYVGRIGIGRVFAGVLKAGQQVAILEREDGKRRNGKIVKLLRFSGLGRVETDMVEAGDLCAVVGLENIDIGDTIADPNNPQRLPGVKVDEPTITMLFRINDSPFSGQDGEYVTSRQLKDRLERELQSNVALRVEAGRTPDEFMVSGRGVLHLGILIENMRREGYELSVGKPIVITREVDGVTHEPFERVVVEAPNTAVGPVMEMLGSRRAELQHMDQRGDMTRMEFIAPARGLIGLRGRLLTATQGEAILHHTFEKYGPAGGAPPGRANGVLISTEGGQATAYSIEQMADRGVMFIKPADPVYPGMLVGEHNRDNDLSINISRAKQLNNIRSANKEATVTLKAPRLMSLEEALEYIEDDELVEVTPKSIRLRKKLLNEADRRKESRRDRDRETARV
ncbi:MAG: translational GTPase TypA [Phycisphaeraceae bacterium]|nr:translational GTPase TypA [Phycisphaeraceae bacterium]